MRKQQGAQPTTWRSFIGSTLVSLDARGRRLWTQATGRIVSPSFVATTLLATALVAGLQLLPRPESSFVWVVVLVSILPAYSAIYHGLLFARAAVSGGRPRAEAPAFPVELARRPAIAFVIASYQEPFDVARMTFDCARDARYPGPREIIVVDNSHDTTCEDFRRWKDYVESHIGLRHDLRVVFAYNEKKGGLKPGNLDLAQSLLGEAQYVVLLDIDSSIPVGSHLLEEAMTRFERQPRLGLLQFHTTATNDHFNGLTGAVAVAQNAVRLKHLVRADGGFAMFYGHNAMWRRSLLDELGPWLEHHRGNVMVTEDLLKTVSAYAKGYTCSYLDVTTGEWIPSSLDALESMWMRWTYGALQVLCKYFGRIVTAPGLRPLERFDLLAFISAYGATALFQPLSLLWLLFLPPAHVTFLTLFMLYLPTLLGATVVYQRYSRELRVPLARKLWDLYAGFFLIEPFIFVVSLRAIFNFVTGKGQGWKVTSKSVEETPTWPQVIRRHAVVVTVAVAILGMTAAVWGLRCGFSPTAFLHYLPTTLLACNLLACVGLFGKQGRSAENGIEGTTIDGYALRNAGVTVTPAPAVASVPLWRRAAALARTPLRSEAVRPPSAADQASLD